MVLIVLCAGWRAVSWVVVVQGVLREERTIVLLYLARSASRSPCQLSSGFILSGYCLLHGLWWPLLISTHVWASLIRSCGGLTRENRRRFLVYWLLLTKSDRRWWGLVILLWGLVLGLRVRRTDGGVLRLWRVLARR